MSGTKQPLPIKSLTPQDWETLIDDFQKWSSQTSFSLTPSSLLDLALSSLLKRDFPLNLKLHILIFLEEFFISFSSDGDPLFSSSLDRLIDSVRTILQSSLTDSLHILFSLREQMMVSATSILISIDAFRNFNVRVIENLVELLLVVVNRPNHGIDRQVRAVACECLRELEKAYPCLLSDIVGHLWGLCQSERTHASQSYILLFTTIIHNIVAQKLNVSSILNTSLPLVPFNVPQLILGLSGDGEVLSGLNYKELRKSMAFLLEWPQVLTPCVMVEFLGMILPLAVDLELQASMLKVQFFGMLYSYDPMLCHVVLMMYIRNLDAFDGQEREIVHRLLCISRETQHYLVFRLLAIHWLLGLNELMLGKDREVWKGRSLLDMGLSFYPSVFDPLALKALKLDVLAFCSMCIEMSGLKSVSGEEVGAGNGKSVVKLFEDGLVSVAAFKWLPPGSTETAVAFRTFHKFLIGASSHSNNDCFNVNMHKESNIFRTVKGMLVDLMLEFQRLVPVIVIFIDRLLGCKKHHWLGEILLRTFDEHLLPKVVTDYTLVSYFTIFDRIAENDAIPPRGLLELLTKFMVFLVEKHSPDRGLKSWSQGSKVLGICRTVLIHHHSSRLFLWLSRLLAFTCLYFPDLEVRDNARIYLRMLICIPGKKLRYMLKLGDQLLGISPSSHSSSFFNGQAPQTSRDPRKCRNLSSYVHFERKLPLLVKQSWTLSLPTLGIGNNSPAYLESIRDAEPPVEERDSDVSTEIQFVLQTERIDQPQEPLRVTDSKISEILKRLRRHFSYIPDFRHMPGIKVKIFCFLKFDSDPFNRAWGIDTPANGKYEVENLPAMFATVLKFSSSAPYGSIPPCHIPFLLGESCGSADLPDQQVSLDIISAENDSGEDERFRANVTIELEPREPTPGLVDVSIETNAENGEIIRGPLQNITVGIEDMFLRSVAPLDIPEDSMPDYYLDLFNALWEGCGTSSNTGGETFLLKGGKGVAAISGTRSVKLLEVPALSLIRATECHLAPFIVSVIGEPLVNVVKDRGIIRNIIWKEVDGDATDDVSTAETGYEKGPLALTCLDDESAKENLVNVSKRNMGCFLVLIFLPPRFHLLFQMEVSDVSTLVQIRTDHWPCLAYIDDYLEALFLS